MTWIVGCDARVVLTNRPRRLTSFDYLGFHRYFLTFCTDSRRRLLSAAPVVDLVLQQIERSAAEEQFAVVAYCFMPDHLHLLVQGASDRSDGRIFIARAKQYSGFYYAKLCKGRLWQRYGYERVLRNEEETLNVARYILENPVRAGLVRRVEDYPFLGSMYQIGEILAAAEWRLKSG